MRIGVERLERRKIGVELWMGKLVDTLGSAQVLQPMLAHIQEIETVGQFGGQQLVRGQRDDDLAAAGRRLQSCAAVERRSEIVAVAFDCLAGMQGHAHVHRRVAPFFAFQRELRIQCCTDSVARTLKCRSKSVAGSRENIPVMLVDHRAHDLVVTTQRLAHRFGVLFPHPRGTLDIGEQKCDCASRQMRHAVDNPSCYTCCVGSIIPVRSALPGPC